ncbi:MAG: ATP-binding cassette domain-containing protein [Spirochaetales bacterium]|nr:ATP-binding cassette domain-containing protein [Spirochaetales bacterium]
MNLISIENLSKTVNDKPLFQDVTLGFDEGEKIGFIGPNGAGKSTLMHILAGEIPADTGKIVFGSRKVQFELPSDALRSGIGMLHQHLQLIPELTVLENIILGSEPSSKTGIINRSKALERINYLCKEFDVYIDPDKTVSSLNADERQKTALLSILFHDIRLLILDEPTTFFSETKTDTVHKLIRKLIIMGKSIIIITHKLKEAVAIADKITVMRAGRTISHIDSSKTTTDQLSMLILGEAGNLPFTWKKSQHGETILEAQNLTFARDGNNLLKIDFKVREREILVVTGIRENGLETLEQLLSGHVQPTSGNLLYKNKILKTNKYNLREIEAGYIPSERIRTGTSIRSSVSDNMILLKYKAFVKWGLLDSKKISNYSAELIKGYSISGKPGQLMSTLSGGNIQRVMISREMESNPDLFIFAEPSRGLDVISKRLIYERIYKLKEKGAGILIISSDIEEALLIADRIIIMYTGKVASSVENRNITRAQIGKIMLGLEE